MDGKLKEKVLEKVKGKLNKHDGLSTPLRIKELLFDVIDESSNKTIEAYEKFQDVTTVKETEEGIKVRLDILKKHITMKYGDAGHANGIASTYKKMYDQYIEITDEIKIQLDVDKKERWRYLIFRTLTAISIALVILITSCISSFSPRLEMPFSSRDLSEIRKK